MRQAVLWCRPVYPVSGQRGQPDEMEVRTFLLPLAGFGRNQSDQKPVANGGRAEGENPSLTFPLIAKQFGLADASRARAEMIG